MLLWGEKIIEQSEPPKTKVYFFPTGFIFNILLPLFFAFAVIIFLFIVIDIPHSIWFGGLVLGAIVLLSIRNRIMVEVNSESVTLSQASKYLTVSFSDVESILRDFSYISPWWEGRDAAFEWEEANTTFGFRGSPDEFDYKFSSLALSNEIVFLKLIENIQMHHEMNMENIDGGGLMSAGKNAKRNPLLYSIVNRKHSAKVSTSSVALNENGRNQIPKSIIAKSDVPIWRRVISGLVGPFNPIIIALYWWMYRYVSDLPARWVLYVFLPLILIEHIFVFKYTGFTASRYLMGYKVVRFPDKKALTFVRVVFRGLVNTIIEGLLFNLSSLASVLIRKDRRAVHDFASGTVAVKANVPLRNRLILAYSYIFVVVFFLTNIVLVEMDSSFIMPKIAERNSHVVEYFKRSEKVSELKKRWMLNGFDTLVHHVNYTGDYKSFFYAQSDMVIPRKMDSEALASLIMETNHFRVTNEVYCNEELVPEIVYDPVNPYASIQRFRRRLSGAIYGSEVSHVYCGEENIVLLNKLSKCFTEIIVSEKAITENVMCNSAKISDLPATETQPSATDP